MTSADGAPRAVHVVVPLANPRAVGSADVVMVCGGGFLTDSFPGQAWPVFERRQLFARPVVDYGFRPSRRLRMLGFLSGFRTGLSTPVDRRTSQFVQTS